VAVTYTAQAATDGALYSTKLALTLILAAIEDGAMLLGHPSVVDASELLPENWWVGLTPGGAVTIPVDMVTPLMSSTAETTDIAGATTIDLQASKSISTGAYDLVFGVSNELRRRDASGRYQVVPIAGSILRSANYTATSLICALATSASTTVGASGDPLTWDVIQEAADGIMITGLNQAGGGVVCILHPRQWAAVKRDLASSSGARANRRELDAFQAAVAVGYQGTVDNIEIWTCDRVTESGGDYSGIMFARGGVVTAVVPPADPFPGQTVVLQTPLVAVTAQYDATDKSGKLIGDMTIGVSILHQELVREILSIGD
jgi:hypothetical protein